MGTNISWVSMPCQLDRVDIVNCELWVCELVIFMNFLYCELVIFVNFLYYKFVILVNLLYHELWTCDFCDLLSTLLYCEVWYVYRSYFRFWPLPVYFPHQTFVFDVSEIPISFPFSILFPIKKYENGNGFSVYRPFPTVFIPSYYYTNNTVAEQVLPISNQIHKQCKNCGTTHAQFSCITSTVTNSVKYLWAKYNTYTHSANYCKASLYHKDYSVPQYLRTQTHPSNYFITSTKEHHTYP
jgi:hypothetical protein